MESYKNRIAECTDLETLFDVWKEAHFKEKDFEKTFPKNNDGKIPSEEFCKNWNDDGYLSDNKDDIDILFILKEPNDQASIEKREFCRKEFWIKNNINKFRCAIPRRMYKITRKMISEDLTKETWIQKTAVMNLNKRGGYNRTDNVQLLNYIKVYKTFICKQIEIINPKIIVFLCGDNDDTKKIISELNLPDKYSVFYCYHPSYKGKCNSFNDDCFLKTIKNINK
ncbi:MAG: hypothetical protein IKB93_02640 [Clostridia bacterium]|nr:hypothetical protein [Clostridia bacterium]